MSRAAVLCGIALSVLAPDSRTAAQHPGACSVHTRNLVTLLETVTDRATGVPLSNALLTVTWPGSAQQQVRTHTDSIGEARICVPANQVITVRITYHNARIAPQTAILSPGAVSQRKWTVDAPGAVLRGLVLDHDSGTPLQNAAVALTNTPLTAMTRQDGRFYFERVPVGDYVLQVEHLAYNTARSAIEVRSEDLDASVAMTPATLPLVPIVVTAYSRRLEAQGFYERKKRGVGTFLGRSQIDAMNVQRASDLLRRVPSSRLIPQTARRNIPPNLLLGRGNCKYRFIVDGARTLSDFEMDFIAPYAIEGVEVYNGLSEIPALFRAIVTPESGSPLCGVVVVWTRNGR